MAAMKKNTIGSQTFNDGVCRIYTIENTAKPGDRPIEKLVQKHTLRYDLRTTGISRYTSFLQVGAQVDKVIRLTLKKDVSPQDICELENGTKYKIVFVQHPKEIRPKCMDLTLQKTEAVYETP